MENTAWKHIPWIKSSSQNNKTDFTPRRPGQQRTSLSVNVEDGNHHSTTTWSAKALVRLPFVKKISKLSPHWIYSMPDVWLCQKREVKSHAWVPLINNYISDSNISKFTKQLLKLRISSSLRLDDMRKLSTKEL